MRVNRTRGGKLRGEVPGGAVLGARGRKASPRNKEKHFLYSMRPKKTSVIGRAFFGMIPGVERVVLGSVRSVLRTWNVQIDDDGVLTATYDHCFHRFVLMRVQFLMGNVGRDVDEVTRACLIDEFQMISPAKAGAAADDVNHGFQFPMMMRTGLGIGLDHHRSRPELLRADPGPRDGFGAGHTGGLRRVRVQLAAANDTQAVVFPIGFVVAGRILHAVRFPAVVTANKGCRPKVDGWKTLAGGVRLHAVN